jgi:ATP synthase F1 delta subunit
MSVAREISKNFIQYLKEQGRYDILKDIVTLLHEELYRNQDITVITAAPLEDKQHHELEKKLTEKWGEHRILISVDPSLLSGLIIRFQDTIIDLSGKNKLNELAQELRSN